MTFDVFLSYNSVDRKVVSEIAEQLRERGVSVWFDVWELNLGRMWQKDLEEAIRKVKSVIVFVGPNDLGPWEDMEMQAFLRQFVKQQSPVIPVLLPGVSDEYELPTFLALFHRLKLGTRVTASDIDELVKGIKPNINLPSKTSFDQNKPAKSIPPNVICPLHGIRTHAAWIRTASETLGETDQIGRSWRSRVEKWNYGYFNVVQFFMPWSRHAKVEWFRRQYTAEMDDRQTELDEARGQYPSIVAHSFGTYILGNALLKYRDIRFSKIVLVGSILSRGFPWDLLVERGQVGAIRNEFGVNDVWSGVASWVILGAGASGKLGFESNHFPETDDDPRFEQQKFLYEHSDYFDRRHIRDSWRPFLDRPVEKQVANHTLKDNDSLFKFPFGDHGYCQRLTLLMAFLLLFALIATIGWLTWHSVFPPTPIVMSGAEFTDQYFEHRANGSLPTFYAGDPKYISRENPLKITLDSSPNSLTQSLEGTIRNDSASAKVMVQFRSVQNLQGFSWVEASGIVQPNKGRTPVIQSALLERQMLKMSGCEFLRRVLTSRAELEVLMNSGERMSKDKPETLVNWYCQVSSKQVGVNDLFLGELLNENDTPCSDVAGDRAYHVRCKVNESLSKRPYEKDDRVWVSGVLEKIDADFIWLDNVIVEPK